MNELLKNTLLRAIHAGADVLKLYFEGTFEIRSKSSLNDLVTEVDKKAEDAIIEVIKSHIDDTHVDNIHADVLCIAISALKEACFIPDILLQCFVYYCEIFQIH